MSSSNAEKNKAIVLEAFGTLFNKLDYVAAEVTARYIGDKLSLAFGKDKKSDTGKRLSVTLGDHGSGPQKGHFFSTCFAVGGMSPFRRRYMAAIP